MNSFHHIVSDIGIRIAILGILITLINFSIYSAQFFLCIIFKYYLYNLIWPQYYVSVHSSFFVQMLDVNSKKINHIFPLSSILLRGRNFCSWRINSCSAPIVISPFSNLNGFCPNESWLIKWFLVWSRHVGYDKSRC